MDKATTIEAYISNKFKSPPPPVDPTICKTCGGFGKLTDIIICDVCNGTGLKSYLRDRHAKFFDSL